VCMYVYVYVYVYVHVCICVCGCVLRQCLYLMFLLLSML